MDLDKSKRSRRILSVAFLAFIALLIILSAFFGNGNKVENVSSAHPNIIFFLVDDLGWQDVSEPFWDKKTPLNEKYNTPNVELLADEGMKFTNAYASCVCSPTRVSGLTGMNAARHRVTNWTLRKNKPSEPEDDVLILPDWNYNGVQAIDSIENSVYATPLPQILRNNGYFTIHCGKAHFGAIGTPGENPKNLGFDVNIAGHAAGAPQSYYGQNNFGNDSLGNPNNIWSVPGLKKYHGKNINLTEALTLEARLAMDSAISQNKPFYLYMAHYTVHTPIMADKGFYQKYLERGYDTIEARYASMIEGMDKSLGDLMTYLKEKNIEDNTIILFMSDNGGLSAVARGGEKHAHNKPLKSGKGSACEGGIREPMIVKWPGITKASSVCEHAVIIEDFFPSILQMAGVSNIETVQQIDGKSFLPLLMNPASDAEQRDLFWHYPNKWGATGPGIGASSTIRSGDWKLIYYYKFQTFELFNLNDDIGELNNLVEEEQDKTVELAKKLGVFLRSVDAQRPFSKITNELVPWPDEVME